MLNEAKYTAKICNEMKRCNAVVLPVIGNYKAGNGWPDRVVAWGGNTYWLEFKGERTKLEAHQRVLLRKLRRACGCAFVCRAPGILQDECGIRLGSYQSGQELLQLLRACAPSAGCATLTNSK